MGTITTNHPRPGSRPRTCTPNFRPTRSRRRSPSRPLDPPERRALAYIAANGDLIIVADRAWLLTPAPMTLLDVLAAIGAVTEDMEPEPEDASPGRPLCDGAGDPDDAEEDDPPSSLLFEEDGGTLSTGSNGGRAIAQRMLARARAVRP